MRLTILVIVLVTLLGSEQSLAQYDEICHYECGIVYCDPYTDFCDYDCYEVCYPYRSQTSSRLPAGRVLGLKTSNQPSRIQTTPYGLPHRASGEHVKLNPIGDARTGKGVRMRIQRVPRLQSGTNGLVREYQRPENFALFQSCL